MRALHHGKMPTNKHAAHTKLDSMFQMTDRTEIRNTIKGALDKYNIYLFISNSIGDFKLSQYRNFQLILPMRFHFMRYFVNSIISRVSHRLLYCVFIEVNFEK